MGYHPETKIQREEAYVNSHAAFVDRTINSREFRLGTLAYVETGHVPHDHFWAGLAKQEQQDPSKFFAHHPQYAGFFTAPAKLGELPQGNVICDVMKDRDIHQHATFAAHHPFYVGLVDRDLRLEAASTISPILPTGSPIIPGVSPISPIVSPIEGVSTGPATPIVPTSTSTGSPPLNSPALLVSVPEPASILMVAVGLVAAIGARRFSRNR